jgi:Na+-translocating ferredoxin:NAD+ oxidoreductase RnfD subunit/NAD-dependent dihydropyrimidine dehydrogenase PreA subunit
MSKPKEYSPMTKDKLMTYTFIALLVITVVSAVLWSPINVNHIDGSKGWNLGLTVAICALISVGISLGIDALFYKLVSDSPLNLMSAAVFGLVVTLSYTLGVPSVNTEGILPVEAPAAFIYVGLISMVGMVLFKKVMNLAGRKLVNPAAAAKFIVMLPLLNSFFIAANHLKLSMSGLTFQIPRLASSLSLSSGDIMNPSFGGYLQSCFGNPTVGSAPRDINWIMLVEKFHGWVGGASSIAVIIVGIALFVLARRYIKWRITLAYFVTIAIMSVLFSVVYADADLLTRLMFEVFIGSSIFMAFFMATDPASTPITYTGQIIFGAGLAILTILIQTYLNFFGGSLLALIIMNLASPALDKVGRLKPMTESKEPKLPKAKQFTADKIKEYQCIRCGACMRVCCHKLSPILIKQAFDKTDIDTLSKLHADYCTGCGHCTFMCPARIDLRKSILQAKGMLRQ